MSTLAPRDRLAEHRDRPHHLGRLAGADVTATIGSIVVGRALRLFLKLDDDQRIADARFQVFACQEEVAAASVVVGMAIGRTPEELLAIDRSAIAAELGGLDCLELPLQPWILEACRHAVAQIHGDDVPPGVAELEELVCRCHGVTAATVRAEISTHPEADVAAIGEATKAGTGCGSCRREVQALIDAQQEPKLEAEPRQSAGKGRVALLKLVSGATEPLVADFAEQGTTLELWDLRGAKVIVRIQADSPERIEAARNRLQAHLQDEVDAALEVVLDA